MAILAVITADRNLVGGGAPIFYAQDETESTDLATMISSLFGASAHDLKNGVYIIVKH